MSSVISPLRAGMMRQRIRIENRVETRNADGGVIEGHWSEAYHLWAEFSERQPGERYADGREITRATGMFKIRYREDLVLNTSQRVTLNGECWEVRRIENVRDARAILILHCELRSEDVATPTITAPSIAGAGALGGGGVS